MKLPKTEILESIRRIVSTTLPLGGKAILFGSQARGDAHRDSDWDILILLDKEKASADDFNQVVYPLFELGWQINEMINPILYTYNEWKKRSFTLFYKNIEQEGIAL
ncbi:MAG: nucleotidyltransferase domain-containing protein [Bacteroidales bacterium]